MCNVIIDKRYKYHIIALECNNCNSTKYINNKKALIFANNKRF